MASAFVLLDAVPGMTDAVYRSLDKLAGRGVAAKEKVKSGSYDILVKVEGPDEDAVQKFIDSQLRFISGITQVRRVRDHASEEPQVQQVMLRLR